MSTLLPRFQAWKMLCDGDGNYHEVWVDDDFVVATGSKVAQQTFQAAFPGETEAHRFVPKVDKYGKPVTENPLEIVLSKQREPEHPHIKGLFTFAKKITGL